MSGLVDLEELVLRCRGRYAKQCIAEAVACYKAGAYRTCIIATWTAVVFDYLDKLRELELSGDSKARAQLQAFEDLRSRLDTPEGLSMALKFEREVLKIASDEFELLTTIEQSDLQRLQEDRNRCAHPSMQSSMEPYEPPAELARTHIRNAVEHLLAREPVQGKAALERLFAEVRSEYFPRTLSNAKQVLEGGPLARARYPLVRNMFVGIAKSFLRDTLEATERERQLVALQCCQLMHRASVDRVLHDDLARILADVADNAWWRVLWLLSRIEGSWEAAGDPVRKKAAEFVRHPALDDVTEAVEFGLQIPALEENVRRTLGGLDYDQIEKLVDFGVCAPCRDRAIELFADAEDYNSATQISKGIIEPLIQHFDNGQVRSIIKASNDNPQVYECYRAIGTTLPALFDATTQWHDDHRDEWMELIETVGGARRAADLRDRVEARFAD